LLGNGKRLMDEKLIEAKFVVSLAAAENWQTHTHKFHSLLLSLFTFPSHSLPSLLCEPNVSFVAFEGSQINLIQLKCIPSSFCVSVGKMLSENLYFVNEGEEKDSKRRRRRSKE